MAILLLLSLLAGLAGVFIYRRFHAAPPLTGATGAVIAWLARFCFFLGFPYLALIGGWLSARSLGLLGLENFLGLSSPSLPQALNDLLEAFGFMLLSWGSDVGKAIILALSAALALCLLGWLYHRQLHSLGSAFTFASFQLSAGQAFYDMIHLAFYRALIWSWSDRLAISSVLSLMLFLAESRVLNQLSGVPFSADSPEKLGKRWLLAVCSAAFFIYVPNIWLAIPAGFLWLAIVNRFQHARLP